MCHSDLRCRVTHGGIVVRNRTTMQIAFRRTASLQFLSRGRSCTTDYDSPTGEARTGLASEDAGTDRRNPDAAATNVAATRLCRQYDLPEARAGGSSRLPHGDRVGRIHAGRSHPDRCRPPPLARRVRRRARWRSTARRAFGVAAWRPPRRQAARGPRHHVGIGAVQRLRCCCPGDRDADLRGLWGGFRRCGGTECRAVELCPRCHGDEHRQWLRCRGGSDQDPGDRAPIAAARD